MIMYFLNGKKLIMILHVRNENSKRDQVKKIEFDESSCWIHDKYTNVHR